MLPLLKGMLLRCVHVPTIMSLNVGVFMIKSGVGKPNSSGKTRPVTRHKSIHLPSFSFFTCMSKYSLS
jgi:hypothetical protein